jgi:hypothetical protein
MDLRGSAGAVIPCGGEVLSAGAGLLCYRDSVMAASIPLQDLGAGGDIHEELVTK